MDKEKLTSHLKGEEEYAIGSTVVDLARQAWDHNRPQTTRFFDPYERRVAQSVLAGIPEVGYLTFGGYKQAERARMVIYPQFFMTEHIQSPIAVLQAVGRLRGASHRDFLGSILGTGIKRDVVGDIIVTDDGCQAVVAAEIVDYLLTHWNQVGPHPIQLEVIDEEQLDVEPERIKEIRSTVASLRVDAVAAAGYGTSRTKMTREIKAERLKVNWKVISNPAHTVEEGDVLSLRGRGRLIIKEVQGKTRKGRINILLHRYY